MSRTTTLQVQALLGADYDGVSDLQQFIDTATVITNRVETYAREFRGTVLSSAELELIERWLSAHFYCQSDKTYSTKATSGASGSFSGQTAMGLDSTLYGQTAMRIDYSGALVKIDKGSVATGAWLGKPPSSQIPYNQRD
jgi:hypothetical protein